MAVSGNMFSALAYAGIGAGLGTIGAAYIQSRSRRAESRANAADMLATGYGGLADRLSRDNEAKDDQIHTLRDVLLKLTDAVDLLLVAMDALLNHVTVGEVRTVALEAVRTAREANRTAKVTL